MALGSRESWKDQGMEGLLSLAEESPGGENVLQGNRETTVLCLEVAREGELKLDKVRRPPTCEALIHLLVQQQGKEWV